MCLTAHCTKRGRPRVWLSSPQISRMPGTKAVLHNITILAFVPYTFFPLEALLCIESAAADALTTFRSKCFFLWQEQISVWGPYFSWVFLEGYKFDCDIL